MQGALFDGLAAVPPDPILGQMEKFNADRTAGKVNLAVGMYFDDAGQIPQLACVEQAAQRVAAERLSNGYLPIDGLPALCEAARDLVFGDALGTAGRHSCSMQTLGGTGALSLGAELLCRAGHSRTVLVSDPSWENHRSIFGSCGFEVATYPYYDAASNTIAFGSMLESLEQAASGTIVVFHASCHNPTGLDLDPGQWREVVETCARRGLVAFVDLAYQGFGQGIDQDRSCIEAFTQAGVALLVANSFSKNMSLYRERVGALHVVCESGTEANRVLGHLKQIARSRYSNPPAYGARLAAKVLTDPVLRDVWRAELDAIRGRIAQVRGQLRELLNANGKEMLGQSLAAQKGMFSYTGLSPRQMDTLRTHFAIYGLDTGRICVAAINSSNLAAAANALVAVASQG